MANVPLLASVLPLLVIPLSMVVLVVVKILLKCALKLPDLMVVSNSPVIPLPAVPTVILVMNLVAPQSLVFGMIGGIGPLAPDLVEMEHKPTPEALGLPLNLVELTVLEILPKLKLAPLFVVP